MRTMIKTLALCFACIACAVHGQTFEPSPSPPKGQRAVVFISDLHLGLGHVWQDASTGTWTKGPWHPMEDFRWDGEFSAFLSRLELEFTKKGTPVDLVILGDFMELWQSPSESGDCIYDAEGKAVPPREREGSNARKANPDLSCTPGDAMQRLSRVLGAHRATFGRLRDFAATGDNRVTLVPGNHDAALIYPDVLKRTLEYFGAPADRLRIAGEGYWRSADGRIFAEHGHFIPDDVNKYRAFPAACTDEKTASTDCRGTAHVFLERPWGEQFVQDVYNRYEERFPIIDNITSEAYGVKVALGEAGAPLVGDALSRGLKFLLFHQSTRQLGELLGGRTPAADGSVTLGSTGGQVEWDIPKIRELGNRFLAESFESDDPLRAMTEAALAQGKLEISVRDLLDSEINELCNIRAARREARTQARQPATVELCPGKAPVLGALKAAVVKTGAQRKSERVEAVRSMLPNDRPTKDFDMYVYAHTHAVHGACNVRSAAGRKLEDSSGRVWNPAVLNTGAWQRLITPEQFANLRDANKQKLLGNYVPEELPACYSMIVVTPYDAASSKGPQGEVWFWARVKGSDAWDLQRRCPEDSWRIPKDSCAD